MDTPCGVSILIILFFESAMSKLWNESKDTDVGKQKRASPATPLRTPLTNSVPAKTTHCPVNKKKAQFELMFQNNEIRIIFINFQ